MQIQGTADVDAAEYVAGIVKKAGYHIYTQGADYWLDLSADSLHRLFMMLDTHKWRTLKKLGYEGKLAFDCDVSYQRRERDGKIYIDTLAAKPAAAPFKLKIVTA